MEPTQARDPVLGPSLSLEGLQQLVYMLGSHHLVGLLTALGKSEHGVYWEPSVKPNHPWSCLFPNLSEYQPHVGPAPRNFRGVTEKQACFLVVFSNPAKAFRLIIFHISRVYRLFMAWYPTLKVPHPHFMPLNTFILAYFSRDGAGEEGKIPAKFLN